MKTLMFVALSAALGLSVALARPVLARAEWNNPPSSTTTTTCPPKQTTTSSTPSTTAEVTTTSTPTTTPSSTTTSTPTSTEASTTTSQPSSTTSTPSSTTSTTAATSTTTDPTTTVAVSLIPPVSLTREAGPSRLADTGFPFVPVAIEAFVLVALGWSVLALRRRAEGWDS